MMFLLLLFSVSVIVASILYRRVRKRRESGIPATPQPKPAKLSVALSIVGDPEHQTLQARLSNEDSEWVTIEQVFLSLGRNMRIDTVSPGELAVSAMHFQSSFGVAEPRRLGPGQQTVIEMPHGTAKSLHLLANHEIVRVCVNGPGGPLATLEDGAISATVAQLMESQDPRLKTRLKQQGLIPTPKADRGDAHSRM